MLSMKTLSFLAALIVLSYAAALSQPQTIVGVQTGGWHFADSQMKNTSDQFEITYQVTGDTVIRTKVYDRKKDQTIPDHTEYIILSHLESHSMKVLSSKSGTPQKGMFPPVVRAVGQPGTDAVEILVIGADFIQSVKSTSDYFVISRFRRK
jgi:hypothetical protein